LGDGGMTQVIECLSSKRKALSSKPSTAKKKKERKKEKKGKEKETSLLVIASEISQVKCGVFEEGEKQDDLAP
jgi:hypothetical protein